MEKRLLQEVMSQVQSRRQEERQKLEPEGRRAQREQLELSSCRWRLRPLGGSEALSLEGTGNKQHDAESLCHARLHRGCDGALALNRDCEEQ
jgi:hypothetical protein